jgi:hypothetical protein
MCLLQHLSHMQSEEADVRSALLTEALARLAPQPLAGAYFRPASSPSAMAATNKCLARSNKSRPRANATKKQEKPYR